jgi:hypothetical protein
MRLDLRLRESLLRQVSLAQELRGLRATEVLVVNLKFNSIVSFDLDCFLNSNGLLELAGAQNSCHSWRLFLWNLNFKFLKTLLRFYAAGV